MNKKYITGLVLTLAATFALVSPVFADTNQNGPGNQGQPPQGMQGGPRGGFEGRMGAGQGGIFGSVTAINGTTLTVSSHGFGKAATTTTAYTVDASSATVTKDRATSTVSAIVTGDMIMVQGTVTGTNVAATRINDMPAGTMGAGRGGFGGPNGTSTRPFASSTSPFMGIQGNGEPVIAGTVSAVNGSSITITNNGSSTYSVDVSNAVITKGRATSTASVLAVNDRVVVQGTVNGTSITASSVFDQGVPPTQNGNGAGDNENRGGAAGFIGALGGSIGTFFKHLFGF